MKFNKDFYDDLPGAICEFCDKLINKYSNEKWFSKAWNEYRDHVLNSSLDDMKMPGYIFKKYIELNGDRLVHHGIKGQKWGVRRYQNEDGSLITSKKKSNVPKTLGLLVGGALVGASAVGAAWYLKNNYNKRILRQKRLVAAQKAIATKAAKKASGAYQTFKNVDVTISKGSEYVKSFMNVKVAKLLT